MQEYCAVVLKAPNMKEMTSAIANPYQYGHNAATPAKAKTNIETPVKLNQIIVKGLKRYEKYGISIPKITCPKN